jgi:hypothetical protein
VLMWDFMKQYYLDMQLMVFKIIISRGKMSMACIKGIKYKMEYTSVHFNFKTKKVEFDKEMTAEIILNDL